MSVYKELYLNPGERFACSGGNSRSALAIVTIVSVNGEIDDFSTLLFLWPKSQTRNHRR